MKVRLQKTSWLILHKKNTNTSYFTICKIFKRKKSTLKGSPNYSTIVKKTPQISGQRWDTENK